MNIVGRIEEDTRMREHPIYKGYYCDKEGNVYSNRKFNTITMLKPTANQKGYLRVKVLGKLRSVSRMVLECYEGLSTLEVDHINRVREDNRLCNLRYVDRQTNVRNRVSGKPILVYDIRTGNVVEYMNSAVLARDLNVHSTTIYKARESGHLCQGRYYITYKQNSIS